MTDRTFDVVGSLVKRGRLAEALALTEKEQCAGSLELEASVAVLRAELLQAAGRNDEARKAARGIRSNGLGSALKARCEMVLGQIRLDQEDPARSTKHFQKAIRLASSVGEMRLVCFAQSKLLTTIADISAPETALALMAEVERNVTTFGDAQSAADFHTRVAQIAATSGHYVQAQYHLGAARLMLAADPNLWLEGSLNLSASAIHFLACEFEVARSHAREALRCARGSGHARTRMAATANLGLLELHLGNLESADMHLGEALALSDRFSVSQISLLDSYAQLQLTRNGDPGCQELLQQIDEKISVYEPSVLSWQQLAVGPTRVRSLLACGQWTSAASCAGDLLARAVGRSDRTHQISLRVLAADALIELGRTEEAATHINAAAELAADVPVAIFAEVERARAALLARSVGRDAARRQFERALRVLSAVGGIAPRMDAALSYLRTMQLCKEIRRALETEPWNLGPLVESTLPAKTANKGENPEKAGGVTPEYRHGRCRGAGSSGLET